MLFFEKRDCLSYPFNRKKPPCEADLSNANLTGYEPKHREAAQRYNIIWLID